MLLPTPYARADRVLSGAGAEIRPPRHWRQRLPRGTSQAGHHTQAVGAESDLAAELKKDDQDHADGGVEMQRMSRRGAVTNRELGLRNI